MQFIRFDLNLNLEFNFLESWKPFKFLKLQINFFPSSLPHFLLSTHHNKPIRSEKATADFLLRNIASATGFSIKRKGRKEIASFFHCMKSFALDYEKNEKSIKKTVRMKSENACVYHQWLQIFHQFHISCGWTLTRLFII